MRAFKIALVVTFIMFGAFAAYSSAAIVDRSNGGSSSYQSLLQPKGPEGMKLSVGFPAPPDKEREKDKGYQEQRSGNLEGMQLAIGFPVPPDRDREAAREFQGSRRSSGNFDSDSQQDVGREDRRDMAPEHQRDFGPNTGTQRQY